MVTNNHMLVHSFASYFIYLARSTKIMQTNIACQGSYERALTDINKMRLTIIMMLIIIAE